MPPRLTLRAVLPAPTSTARRYAQGHEHRPRPASSRPVPGRRSGVNRCAIEHNRAFCKPSQSLRQGFAWWPGASRPSGSQKGRLCLAPLRVVALRRLRQRRLQSQSVRPRRSRRRSHLSRRSRAKVELVPPPARRVAFARLRPSRAFALALGAPRHPSAPTRVPRAGAPCKARSGAEPWEESSRRLPGQGSAVLAASRPSPSGARAARP